jgi:uncharacterized protein
VTIRPRAVAASLLVVAAIVVSVKAYRTYAYVRSTFHRPHLTSVGAEVDARLRAVSLHTGSGLPLLAWYLPAQNGVVIVYAHGARARGLDLAPEALGLARAGYGALLLDMPGCGGSSGDGTWGEEALSAFSAGVDFAAAQSGARLGAYGFSLGSSVVAHVASADPRVAAVVLAGAFPDEEAQLEYEYGAWGPVTALPAVYASRREGLAFDDLRTADVIARIAPRPLLLVQGAEDPVTSPDMARALFDRAGRPRDIDVIPGARHGLYWKVAGDAYVERLRRFFDGALTP